MTMSVATSRGNAVARTVFAGLPSRYDRLAYLLSFGQDRRWRGAVVRRVAAGNPTRVLDVATGPAGVALALTAAGVPRVIGVDLNMNMLREGQRSVRAAQRADRVDLVAGRAEQLPFVDSAFDGLSFAYLLRYVDDPAATLVELGRCLRPGATMSSLEFFVPPRLAWRALWRFYTAAGLPLAGFLTGGPAWWRVGRFLGPSIRRHYARYDLEWHLDAWRQAGFTDVGFRVMSVGGGLVMWGTKAAAG